MGTSQDYWESLIAAGKSTEKESLEARSLHAPPACPSQQAQRPGSIAEEVDTENESLHNKEKKIREVLRFDGGEKQTMPPFDNGATSFKGKSVFPNCEQCSRKFATAYALNQHNAAKHQ
ncbi:hypothetical protein O6H91_Y146500 [Diphasiastrum complanatum]|nr:hypothetical protein O6H91_Y146500 [Diphasiastrum complanatum]